MPCNSKCRAAARDCFSRAFQRLRAARECLGNWVYPGAGSAAAQEEEDEEEEEEEEDEEDSYRVDLHQDKFTLRFKCTQVESAFAQAQNRLRAQSSTMVIAMRALAIVFRFLLQQKDTGTELMNQVSNLHVSVFMFAAVCYTVCRELAGPSPSKRTIKTFVTLASACIAADVFTDSLWTGVSGTNSLVLASLLMCSPVLMRFSWMHHSGFALSSVLGCSIGMWLIGKSTFGPLALALPAAPLAILLSRRSDQASRDNFRQQVMLQKIRKRLDLLIDDGRQPLDVCEQGSGACGMPSFDNQIDLVECLVRDTTAEVKHMNRLKHDQLQFMQRMVHELRESLTGLMGSSELLSKSKTLSDADRQLARLLHVSGSQLMELVADCSDLFKLRHSPAAFALHSKTFTLQSLVRKLRETFDVKASIQNTSLQFDVQDISRNLYLVGDEKRIQQVVASLLSCALNKTGDGDMIVCSLRLAEDEEQQQQQAPGADSSSALFQVKISDDGQGLSVKDESVIFDPFTQERFGRAGNTSLSVANELVKVMGTGSINVKTGLGAGTVFEFSIKLGRVQFGTINNRGAESVADGVSQPAPLHHLPLTNIRVLIAEDTRPTRMIIKRSLQLAGASVVDTCQSGKEAVELVRKNTYDCVLMDMCMPVMNGVEATTIIKESLPKPTPSIIGFTGDDDKKTEDQFLKAGAIKVLVKPVKVQQLIAIVKSIVQKDCTDAPALVAAGTGEGGEGGGGEEGGGGKGEEGE